MKKHFISLALFIGMGTAASAQINLVKTDMPLSGQTIYRSTAATTGTVDYLSTGTNFLWDFSQLTESGKDTSNYVSVSSTPFGYQFYFNNSFLYPTYKADFAIKAPDFPSIPGSPVTITNVYNYFKNNNNEYAQVGFGASVSGLPTSVRLDSLDYLYHYPVNYGNSDSCVSRFTASVPSVGFIKERKKRRNQVDGWGILRLPNDTVQHAVLRIKTTINQVDSVRLDTLGFTFPVTRNSIEYKWIGKGFSEPLLQITTTVGFSGAETVSAITYKYTAPNTSGIENLGMQKLQLMQNPVECCLLFTSMPATYRIFSTSGSAAYTGSLLHEGSQEIDTRELAPGIYLLQVNDGKHVYQARFIKAN